MPSHRCEMLWVQTEGIVGREVYKISLSVLYLLFLRDRWIVFFRMAPRLPSRHSWHLYGLSSLTFSHSMRKEFKESLECKPWHIIFIPFSTMPFLRDDITINLWGHFPLYPAKKIKSSNNYDCEQPIFPRKNIRFKFEMVKRGISAYS